MQGIRSASKLDKGFPKPVFPKPVFVGCHVMSKPSLVKCGTKQMNCIGTKYKASLKAEPLDKASLKAWKMTFSQGLTSEP